MRTTVAVIRGGPHEYEASIRSGAALLRAFDMDRYDPRDIIVSPESYWYRAGVAMSPERALRGADAVINCVHGRYGQDGWLAHLLQKLGVRALGSRPASSARAFDRAQSRAVAREAGLRVPKHCIVMRGEDTRAAAFDLFRTFPMPAMVKPVGGLRSPEAIVASDLDTLERLLALALRLAPRAMVEEYIAGEPISVGVLESVKGAHAQVLFSAELAEPAYRALAEATCAMHERLDLKHLSESRFILTPRGSWYLKTNAFPDLGDGAPFSEGLKRQRIAMPAFAEHVVDLVLSS